MKKEYKIAQSGSRDNLMEQINAILADNPHEVELGEFAVVDTEEYTTFYQSYVRTTLTNADFPGFDGVP